MVFLCLSDESMTFIEFFTTLATFPSQIFLLGVLKTRQNSNDLGGFPLSARLEPKASLNHLSLSLPPVFFLQSSLHLLKQILQPTQGPPDKTSDECWRTVGCLSEACPPPPSLVSPVKVTPSSLNERVCCEEQSGPK